MEIERLLKKIKKKKKKIMMIMKKKMTRNREIAYERILGGLARIILLGIWMARYWDVSDIQLVLKPWLSILAAFGDVL